MNQWSSQNQNGFYDVLLVESEPEAISPIIESFEDTERTNEVYIVTDYSKTLDFVHKKGEHSEVPRPDLIIVDLYPPEIRDSKFITELKRDQKLKSIPVLVMTTSAEEEEINQLYNHNANAYIKKPDSTEELEDMAQTIEDFWLNTAILPPK